MPQSVSLSPLSRPMRALAGSALALMCAATAPCFAAGVLVANGRSDHALRIQDHLVTIEINDRVALTRVHQTFENTTDQRLEATYLFPIPEGADLTDFRMSFDGKMVKGEVLEAKQAREVYESIVRQKKDPGLIEFIGRRLLKARVFPIEPKSTTTIEVSYQQVTDSVSEMWRYQYPLRTPGHNSMAYGTVRFDVTLHSSSPLRGLWSPTHEVEVVRKGEHDARIAFERNGVSLGEDFILLYDAEDRDVGLSVVAYKENDVDSGHFLLLLAPKALWDEGESVAQDYVFVVDTSGSMASDSKIEQVKEALGYCVNRLEPRDRFSIVRFSTGFDLVFDTLTYATGDAKKSAEERIAKFKASGGTNIQEALEAALDLRPDATSQENAKRPFVIVFLTDGQGDQPREAVETMLAEKTRTDHDSIRMFPFGVGHDVNTIMLDGLAMHYGGLPTYVQPGETLEHSLGDFFAVFSEPVLTDLKLELPDAQISDQYPPRPGDLYHGRQILLAGRFDKKVRGPVRLTARRGDRKVEFSWNDVSFEGDGSADYVPKLWAGRKIAYLVDRIRVDGESSEMIEEILKLSIAHGIQTPYSSWLVAPERNGRPVLGDIPTIRHRLGKRGANGTPVPVIVGGQVFGDADDGSGSIFDDAPSFDLFTSPATVNRIEELAESETLSFPWMSGSPDENERSKAARRAVDALESVGYDAVDLRSSSGERAVGLASRLAQVRGSESLEGSSMGRNRATIRRVGSRDYFLIGAYLVDGAFATETEIVKINFASDAYFDLITLRPEWKAVLAFRGGAVLMANAKTAILVVSENGLDELTEEHRKMIKAGFVVVPQEEAAPTKVKKERDGVESR